MAEILMLPFFYGIETDIRGAVDYLLSVGEIMAVFKEKKGEIDVYTVNKTLAGNFPKEQVVVITGSRYEIWKIKKELLRRLKLRKKTVWKQEGDVIYICPPEEKKRKLRR